MQNHGVFPSGCPTGPKTGGSSSAGAACVEMVAGMAVSTGVHNHRSGSSTGVGASAGTDGKQVVRLASGLTDSEDSTSPKGTSYVDPSPADNESIAGAAVGGLVFQVRWKYNRQWSSSSPSGKSRYKFLLFFYWWGQCSWRCWRTERRYGHRRSTISLCRGQMTRELCSRPWGNVCRGEVRLLGAEGSLTVIITATPGVCIAEGEVQVLGAGGSGPVSSTASPGASIAEGQVRVPCAGGSWPVIPAAIWVGSPLVNTLV